MTWGPRARLERAEIEVSRTRRCPPPSIPSASPSFLLLPPLSFTLPPSSLPFSLSSSSPLFLSPLSRCSCHSRWCPLHRGRRRRERLVRTAGVGGQGHTRTTLDILLVVARITLRAFQSCLQKRDRMDLSCGIESGGEVPRRRCETERDLFRGENRDLFHK